MLILYIFYAFFNQKKRLYVKIYIDENNQKYTNFRKNNKDDLFFILKINGLKILPNIYCVIKNGDLFVNVADKFILMRCNQLYKRPYIKYYV